MQVSVYVVFAVGETKMGLEPLFNGTAPMPWSIEQLIAFNVLQDKLDFPGGTTEVGFAAITQVGGTDTIIFFDPLCVGSCTLVPVTVAVVALFGAV